MKPVAIVGTNVLTRSLIDWTLDADYWVFNEVAALSWPKRIDGSFQMHIPALWRTKENINYAKYYEWLQQAHNQPIWMQDVYSDVPDSVRYPKDEIVERFLKDKLVDENGQEIEYFTSTAAYALALALYQQRPIIYLFGIEMASDTEFIRQKPGFTFWCGVAAGLGIKIVKRSQSLLFNEKIYGYGGEVTIPLSEIAASVAELKEAEIASAASLSAAKKGAEQWLTAAFSASKREEVIRLVNVFIDANKEVLDATFSHGQIIGALNADSKFSSKVQAQLDAVDGKEEGTGLQRMELELYLGQLRNELEKTKIEAFAISGKAQSLVEMIPMMANTDDAKKLAEMFRESQNKAIEASFRYGQVVGALNETTKYLKKVRDLIDAAGGERALKMLLEKQ